MADTIDVPHGFLNPPGGFDALRYVRRLSPLLVALALALPAVSGAAQATQSSESLMKILDTEWQLAGVLGLDFMEAYLAHGEGISAAARAPVAARIKTLRKQAAKSLKTTWGTFRDDRKAFDTWKREIRYWPKDKKGILERRGKASNRLKGPCAKQLSWTELYDAFAGCSGAARSELAQGESDRRAALQQNAATLNYMMAGGKGGYMIDTSFDPDAYKSEKVAQMRAMQCMALTVQASCFNKLEQTALDRIGIGHSYRANAHKKPLGTRCAGGDGQACAELGELIRSASPNRAEFLLAKACTLGVHRVCKDGLEVFDKSGKLRLPKKEHMGEVLPLYRKGCDAGDVKACEQLGGAYDELVTCLKKRANNIDNNVKGQDYGDCELAFTVAPKLVQSKASSSCSKHSDCKERMHKCRAGECAPISAPGRVERELRLAQYDAMAKACAANSELCGLTASPLKYRSKFIVQEKLRKLPADIQASLSKKPVDPDCKRAPCYPKRPTKKQAGNMKKWAKSFASACKRLDPQACTKHYMLTLLHKQSHWFEDSKEVAGIQTACYAGDWWACYNLSRRQLMYRKK